MSRFAFPHVLAVILAVISTTFADDNILSLNTGCDPLPDAYFQCDPNFGLGCNWVGYENECTCELGFFNKSLNACQGYIKHVSGGICLRANENDLLSLEKCDFNSDNQIFYVKKGAIINLRTQRCIEVTKTNNLLGSAYLAECDYSSKQQWRFVIAGYTQTLAELNDIFNPESGFYLGGVGNFILSSIGNDNWYTGYIGGNYFERLKKKVDMMKKQNAKKSVSN